MKQVVRYYEERQKNSVNRMHISGLDSEEKSCLKNLSYKELLTKEETKQDIIVLEVEDFANEKYAAVRELFEKITTTDGKTEFVANGFIICSNEKFDTREDILLQKCQGRYVEFSEYAGRTAEAGSKYFIPEQKTEEEKVFVCVNK